MTVIEFFSLETIIGIASVSLWFGFWTGVGAAIAAWIARKITGERNG